MLYQGTHFVLSGAQYTSDHPASAVSNLHSSLGLNGIVLSDLLWTFEQVEVCTCVGIEVVV